MSDRLLTIDVSSELATLCDAQLRGTWQVPAELIRLALRIGATEVTVRSRSHKFEISWNGPLIESTVLADLRSALDAELSPDDRQRAIAALETSKMEGLLWAAGLRDARIWVVSSDVDRRWTFEGRRRHRPLLKNEPGSPGPNSVSIRWGCLGLDRRRALRWLSIATRFAPARILIDGQAAPRGFSGGLYHLRLEEPVPCRLGLTRTGDEPTLWLLRDGVVSARASVPGYPPFEAAVELGGKVAPGASAADLRHAVTPFLSELVDRAVWMMVEVSDKLPELAVRDRERLSVLLLRAARKGIRTQEIFRLPLLETASDDGHRLSVEEIRELADLRGGGLAAIEDGEHTTGNVVDPRSTVLASSEVRHLLTTLTGVRFQSPSRHFRKIPKRVADRLKLSVGHLRRRIRGVLARRDVPPRNLQPGETIFLNTLCSAVSPLRVRLCEGRGTTGRTARAVVLHRSHPAIEAGTDLVAADSSWIYPLLLALDTGREPSDELRGRWLEAIGAGPPGR